MREINKKRLKGKQMKSVKLKIKKIRELMNETKFKREYKFRAWDSKINKMFYSDDCFFCLENGNLLERDGENGFDNDSQIVMQLTGVKDANGKEIYEDDILIYELNIPSLYLIVKWDNDTGGFFLYDQESLEKDTYWNDLYFGKECEVLGNIYENPELLEVKND